MSDDIRRLFELAAREMRPEFRASLIELVEAERALAAVDPSGQSAAEPVLIELEGPPRRRRRRHWRPSVWLGVAAAVTALLVGVGIERARQGESPVDPASPMGKCAGGDALGVVPTAEVVLRVTLLAGGSEFCIVDDATGAPVELVEIGTADAPDDPSSGAPVLVRQAAVHGAALVYVISVPEGMPVSSVASVDGPLTSFTSTVGRRLLVIDTRTGENRRNNPAAYDLNLLSSTGTPLATLTPDAELIDLNTAEGP